MSSKKKNQLSECSRCNATLLAKDLTRHDAFCATPESSEVPVLVKNGIFHTFTTHIDKYSEFLPPDAFGWLRKYSILVHPNTLDAWGVSARQPCLVKTAHGSNVAVAWPCKSVGLLKIASSILAKEKPCDVTPVFKYSVVDRISLELDKSCTVKPDTALQEFLEVYLASSYLQPGSPVSLSYYGQKVIVAAQTPLEIALQEATINENESCREPTVLALSSKCSVRLESPPITDELSDDLGIDPDGPMERIGGMFSAKTAIMDYVVNPHLRGGDSCSVLLWGLPGSGKTLLMEAVAQLLGSSSFMVSSLDMLVDQAALLSPKTVLLLDLPKLPETHKAFQLIPQLISQRKVASIVMAVRSADEVELGLRVRFPIEVEITVPTEAERAEILGVLTGVRPPTEDLLNLAKRAHGFTGGDLESVVRAAQYTQGETMAERFEKSRRRVRPTGIRQFILEVPNVRWEHIGGNEELKEEIQQAVIWPQSHPEAFERFGIDPPSGILLYGPPGCSKTLVARALANESKMNFLAVKGPELFNKWVGESEKAIRDLFARARQVAPTIVFFDEIDAVGASRGSSSSSGVSDRVLAQLLTELDGLEKQSGVILLAATNRPDQLDSALLRPGRLDRSIYVGLPCASTRRAVLTMRMAKMQKAEDVLLEHLVDRTEGYSGAELVALCRTSALIAMRENVDCQMVEWRHFESALQAIVPRTEKHLLEIYERFRKGNVV